MLTNPQDTIMTFAKILTSPKQNKIKEQKTNYNNKKTVTLPNRFDIFTIIYQINPLSSNPTKWSNTLKTIAIAGELFECV